MPKSPYIKQPKLRPKKMQRVSSHLRGMESASTYEITGRKNERIGPFKVGIGQQPYYVRAYKSEKVHEIMSELRKAGLNVEEPGSASRKTVTISRHIGKPLPAALRWLPEKRKNRLILDAFELLGKIHAREVRHGHPHVLNIMVDNKGRVGYTDFRMAEKIKVNWESAQDVAVKFWRDYAFIGESNLRGASQGRVIPTIKMSPRLMEEGFKLLVSQYPCSDAVKAIVFREITGRLARSKRWER